MKIEYADENLNFALLSDKKDGLNLIEAMINPYKLLSIQKSMWLNSEAIEEGDRGLYIGYPLPNTITHVNYPISRTGMIAQLIDNRNYFLIDGFVQHGHSGCPVFLIKEKGANLSPKWEVKLIEITKGFPTEYSAVLENVNYKSTKQKVVVNPGFTFVTKMDTIISKINLLTK